MEFSPPQIHKLNHGLKNVNQPWSQWEEKESKHLFCVQYNHLRKVQYEGLVGIDFQLKKN